MRRVGIIILAAGASTRLGRPKQLLPFQGRSLIQHAVGATVASKCAPVIVVLGAHADLVKNEIVGLPAITALNPDWERGMGSSVKTGMEKLGEIDGMACRKTDGVLIMLGDQPFITTEVINELARTFSEQGGIVASSYNDTVGVPAVFDRDYYARLSSLSHGRGAKELFEFYADKVRSVPFPGGAIDIDTPQDYARVTEAASFTNAATGTK